MKKYILINLLIALAFSSCKKLDKANPDQNILNSSSKIFSKLDGDNGGESEFEWETDTIENRICWIDPNLFSGDDFSGFEYENPRWSAEYTTVTTGNHTYQQLVCRNPGQNCGRIYVITPDQGIIYIGLYVIVE